MQSTTESPIFDLTMTPMPLNYLRFHPETDDCASPSNKMHDELNSDIKASPQTLEDTFEVLCYKPAYLNERDDGDDEEIDHHNSQASLSVNRHNNEPSVSSPTLSVRPEELSESLLEDISSSPTGSVIPVYGSLQQQQQHRSSSNDICQLSIIPVMGIVPCKEANRTYFIVSEEHQGHPPTGIHSKRTVHAHDSSLNTTKCNESDITEHICEESTWHFCSLDTFIMARGIFDKYRDYCFNVSQYVMVRKTKIAVTFCLLALSFVSYLIEKQLFTKLSKSEVISFKAMSDQKQTPFLEHDNFSVISVNQSAVTETLLKYMLVITLKNIVARFTDQSNDYIEVFMEDDNATLALHQNKDKTESEWRVYTFAKSEPSLVMDTADPEPTFTCVDIEAKGLNWMGHEDQDYGQRFCRWSFLKTMVCYTAVLLGVVTTLVFPSQWSPPNTQRKDKQSSRFCNTMSKLACNVQNVEGLCRFLSLARLSGKGRRSRVNHSCQSGHHLGYDTLAYECLTMEELRDIGTCLGAKMLKSDNKQTLIGKVVPAYEQLLMSFCIPEIKKVLMAKKISYAWNDNKKDLVKRVVEAAF